MPASTSFSFSLDHGLSGLGATEDNDPLRSRANGSASFTNASLTIGRNQPIAGPLSLYTEATAQLAITDPLLSPAECSYGGVSYGRGYDSGAHTGDHCAMAIGAEGVVQVYGFGDYGVTREKGTLLPAQTRQDNAASLGIGVRMGWNDWLDGYLEIAQPLDGEYVPSSVDEPRIFLGSGRVFRALSAKRAIDRFLSEG